MWVAKNDTVVRTPWGWLRGFGWFLVLWPVLATMGLDEFADEDLSTIVLVMFGPAAIGVVLLAVDALLTLVLAKRLAAMPQHRPSVYRDISNTALTFATLLLLALGLGALSDGGPLFESQAVAWACARVLGVSAAIAVVFRWMHYWRRGRATVVDLGPGWNEAPQVIRWLGYLTLVPMLLVTMVMIADTIDVADTASAASPDSEFSLTAWATLPWFLWLGQRSAMATAPRAWAKTPWDALLRQSSLELPWWLLALALGIGFTLLTCLLPFNLDGSMSVTGQVLSGLFLTPMGLLVAFAIYALLGVNVAPWLRRWRVCSVLALRPQDLAHWEVVVPPALDGVEPRRLLRVATQAGATADFELGDDAARLASLADWLETTAKPAT